MSNNENKKYTVTFKIDGFQNVIENNNIQNEKINKGTITRTVKYTEEDTVLDVITTVLHSAFRMLNNKYLGGVYESLIDPNNYKMNIFNSRLTLVSILLDINFSKLFSDEEICSIKYFPQNGAGIKEYIKLQKGGKRLLRYGKRGGKYYMKGGKRIYVKN